MSSRRKAAARVGGFMLVLAAIAAPLTMACLDRELRPLNPCVVSGVVDKIDVENIEKVDLLFMVDNSNSMSEEQTALAREFPRLVSVLASGDKDGDGMQDFPPVKSLHVGVISSDMGTGGVSVPTCDDQPFGDDGILRTSGNTDLPGGGCDATYPNFLTFDAPDSGEPDPGRVDSFAQDFKCVAKMGTGGCGFEQQLEAALKALTPSSSDITFNMGTTGHGDGANDGFLRDRSLLSIILVTDEDDCSVSNPRLFDPMSDKFTGELNLRCWQYGGTDPSPVHPISRFVDGYLALREKPSLLMYGAITGVPPELIPEKQSDLDYDKLLCNQGPMDNCDSRMEKRPDPMDMTQLEPSCNTENGKAFPPQRIVSVGKRLKDEGANSVITSICQESFTPALDAIINKIADVVGGSCLPRELNPDSTGKVNCDVVEVLPAEGEYTRCSDLEGRESFDPVRMSPEEDKGEICRVPQISRNDLVMDGGGCRAPSDAQGWFYDDCTADLSKRCSEDQQQRIKYTEGNEPATGVTVRLECLQSVESTSGEPGGGERRVGAPCNYSDLGNNQRCDGGAGPQQWCCERKTNTWRRKCGSKADCTEVNLGGYACPTPETSESLGLSPVRVCVNPTCQ